MAEKQNTPEIRFEGFTDPWEQRKLGDSCTFTKGRGYSKADIRDSGTPLILYGRLYTKYQSRIDEVDSFAEALESSLFSSGNEVIVPASGETAEDIAVAASVRSPGIMLGGDLNVAKPDEKLDPDFLALGITYGSAHQELAKRAQGKSVVHIHNEDIADVDFAYPDIPEQRAISKSILNLDQLITLHQRMCPIFCFCAHGSRTNFESILQGLLRVLRYPRPVPKVIASPSAPASNVFDTAGDVFVCGSSSAGASLANSAIEPLSIFCTLIKGLAPTTVLRYR